MTHRTARSAAGFTLFLVCLALTTFAGPAVASRVRGGSSSGQASVGPRGHGSRLERSREARVRHAAEQAAIGRAAELATILATRCNNTELLPSDENLGLVRRAVLCLVNRERAQHGVLPLTTTTDLEQAALEHAQELIVGDYFAHVTPSGYTPTERIRATGYIPGSEAGYVIGENLAWGTLNLSTPASIVAAWLASPGHLANILESRYKETGIGVAASVPSSLGDGQPGALYAQEFGVILH
jgi:uncharacterized protein YkwD